MNWDPLSDTMFRGVPCNLKISLMKTSDNIDAVGRPFIGMKCACFENLSTTTSMVSMPLDLGNSTIKSIDMCVHGRSGIGNG
ncbi:hypothetical protein FKM82_024128 [Ascaphus truei]